MGELWNRLNEKQKKLYGWLLFATIVGVGILIMQPRPSEQNNSVIPMGQNQGEYSSQSLNENDWGGELVTMLNAMLGGKRSQVFLTLEGGPKLNIAYSTTEEIRSSAEGVTERRFTSTPVTIRDDGARKELPLVLEQLEPQVRGVLVVVDHTPDAALRLQIAQAVSTVLQVPMYRIEVLFKQ